MWFGTRDGLDRFDGYAFKVFRNNPESPTSIGSNFIYSLYQDKSGRLWVGTSKGLYQYNDETESFMVLKSTANHGVGLVREDGHGFLWFIQDQTLVKYNLKQNKAVSYARSKYFEAAIICIDKNQALWVATADGKLEKYNYLTDNFTAYQVFDHSPFSASHYITCIYETGQNSLLIGTNSQGIKLFDITTGTYTDLLTHGDDNTGLYVRDFIKSGDGEFWIATESGVFIYNINTRLFTNLRKDVKNPFAISDNAVYSLCIDKEGGFWAGTYFGGLNYFNPQYNNFERFFAEGEQNGLKGNIVRELCQYKNKLWIGTEDAGLNMMDLNTGKFKNFAPAGTPGSISYSNVHGLLIDHDQLWIGTYEHGLDVMDLKTERVIKHYTAGPAPNQLKSNFIVTLCRTTGGNILIGTPGGLYQYNAIADNFDLATQIPSNRFVYGILEDKDGSIWVGTLGSGLYHYDIKTGRVENFTNRPNDGNSISSNAITSIFQDHEKNIWITTEDGGLNRYLPKTKTFKHYTTKDGFPNNFLFKILEDDYGRLWISSTKGLVCFEPISAKLTIFTQANGLLSDQFNYNSAFKDEKGRLYFGCIKGMIRFNPYEFKHQVFKPNVYITGIQVDNKEVDVAQGGSPLKHSIIKADKVILQPDQTSISVDFAALSYAAPQMTRYAYKMEGLDNKWTYLKTNRKVYFTKLSAGTYTFRVRTFNNANDSAGNEAVLSVVILPPFYLTVWAYILYLLAAITAIYLLVKNYHHKIEAKNKRKIELLENEMSKEVYQAKIEFFTNITHEIRTPLTLIKAPLEKIAKVNDPEQIKDYVDVMQKNTNRLLTLTDQLLDFRRAEVKGFRLNFVHTHINETLRDIFKSFEPAAEQRAISFYLYSPDEEISAYVDVEAFHKILSNLIGNAVKYAGKIVEVNLRQSDKSAFTISIKNDGNKIANELGQRIFEPFFRINEFDKTGTGIGLPLARSLAELHNGSVILDSTDDELNTFVLTLPIHQEIEFNLLHEHDELSEAADVQNIEPGTDDKKKPIILLVEDNRDIQDFIARELSVNYTTIKAPNGQSALEALQNQMVDLIVSDIMMPVMDGLELCTYIKTNIAYSHIPVILLTAKNTLESKIQGLEHGADAYIEKPFSPEHLSVQIANILRNRAGLREHFLHTPSSNFKSIAYSEADEEFLEMLNNAILAELNNPDFDIDQLADKLCMGRRTLFRKIKAISNLSPAEMITLARLKRSAELLSSGKYRVYEVADLVGFSSSTVFARIFQKQFGMTPSEYASTTPAAPQAH